MRVDDEKTSKQHQEMKRRSGEPYGYVGQVHSTRTREDQYLQGAAGAIRSFQIVGGPVQHVQLGSIETLLADFGAKQWHSRGENTLLLYSQPWPFPAEGDKHCIEVIAGFRVYEEIHRYFMKACALQSSRYVRLTCF